MNLLAWLASESIKYKKEFMGFSSEAQTFNETVLIYKRLDAMLGISKKTLFGNELRSIDILAYAYLKY